MKKQYMLDLKFSSSYYRELGRCIHCLSRHMYVLVCPFSYVFVSLFFILHILCFVLEINFFDRLNLREDNHIRTHDTLDMSVCLAFCITMVVCFFRHNNTNYTLYYILVQLIVIIYLLLIFNYQCKFDI